MIGMTSVTFRKKSIEEVIKITTEADLEGIEWGGDVHVPAGEFIKAKEIAEKTRDVGLKVLSYGSYHTLLQNDVNDFKKVLKTANIMGTDCIRIWAGKVDINKVSSEEFIKASQELKVICKMAREYGVSISLEKHRKTLTHTTESSLHLLQLADCENLRTYWQPSLELSVEDNCKAINFLKPYISNIHVFKWNDMKERFPLSEGKEWPLYISELKADLNIQSFILEFVKDDSDEVFLKDAVTLRSWLCN